MEPKFKTSFIPKQPITGTATKKKGGGLGIISLILSILAMGIIALAVGVFLYQQLLDTSVDRKRATLDRAQAAFEPTLIEELVRVDNRLNAAEEILDNHVSISVLFDLLERLTLNSVRFESFEYSFLEDDRINISMRGNAKNFSGVALQADIFGRDRLINEPIFSGLNLDQKGNVVFDFTATIDRSLVLFVNNLSSFSPHSENVTNLPTPGSTNNANETIVNDSGSQTGDSVDSGAQAEIPSAEPVTETTPTNPIVEESTAPDPVVTPDPVVIPDPVVEESSPQTLVVDIEGFSFKPKVFTVEKGTTVIFTNKDGVPHTVTSDVSSSAGGIDSGFLAGGGDFKFTFTDSGTYTYHCDFHPSMKATIIVE